MVKKAEKVTESKKSDKPEQANKLRVKDFVITDEFATVGEDMTVRDAIKMLLDMKRGVVLIKNNDQKVIGVLTERKILKGIMGLEKDPLGTGVAKVMDTHIMHIGDYEELEVALVDIKKNRPAAVIVSDDKGAFKGYFSPIDYIEAEQKLKALKKQG